MINKVNYCLLAIGKTQESTETAEFKKYIGVGSSFVVAVNPTKKELETIYGREMTNDPEYVVDTDNGKEARITFVVKTDPNTCNGVELLNRVMFTFVIPLLITETKLKYRLLISMAMLHGQMLRLPRQVIKSLHLMVMMLRLPQAIAWHV